MKDEKMFNIDSIVINKNGTIVGTMNINNIIF